MAHVRHDAVCRQVCIFMQVSKWLSHSMFTLTLETYGDWIPEAVGESRIRCHSSVSIVLGGFEGQGWLGRWVFAIGDCQRRCTTRSFTRSDASLA